MNEMLLHYFWRNKFLVSRKLRTTDNRELTIVHTGFPHQDEGPDFKQAVIRIDKITWVGDVEIHIRTSDWLRHGHQTEEKYQSVILHVVYQNDMTLNPDFPTLELKNYISSEMIAEYEKLSLCPEPLPCRRSLSQVSSLHYASWLSRLAVMRMERKQSEVFQVLHECHDSWQEAVFRCFVVNFGFRTNAPAFELLSKHLSYKHLLKHKDSRLQVYSLVFGQAGMLEEELPEDSYYQKLQMEYQYLRYKYGLLAVPAKVWNLLRLRPRNFPCLRLAQLSECLYRIPDIIEQILSGKTMLPLQSISEFEPHEYWKNHLHFGRSSPEHSGVIGRKTLDLLLINTVIPVRLAYSVFRGETDLYVQAMGLLEQIPFERNSITKLYAEVGFPADHALYSQAILELHSRFCSRKLCLKCDLGCLILKRKFF